MAIYQNHQRTEYHIKSNYSSHLTDPLFQVGEKIRLNAIQGYLQSRIIFFLMNIHNKYRTIYFARVSRSVPQD